MSAAQIDPEPPVVNLSDVRARQKLDDMLAKSDGGHVLPTVSNMLAILRHDPMVAGLVTLNQLTHETALLRAPPRPDDSAKDLPGPYPRQWTDADEALILAYIQRSWCPRANDKSLRAAMVAESAMRGFHPITTWLDTLQWDGTHRLDNWLCHTFGAPDTPYIRDVASKFLIAAVRRVRQPGCKFDYMPVLEGDQGIGKSTAIKTLFSENWFSDSISHDLASKDAAINLIGVWCLEMAEIDQLVRNDVETIKAFLSRATDKYRPPFGRSDVSRPRQGVLIGTTNASDYLRDSTGNRRFWPVPCQYANVEWIAAHRDQLWAEANARDQTDEPIWITEPDIQAAATEQQSARLYQDAWHERVANHIQWRHEATTPEILETALSVPIKDHTRALEMRVAAILKILGWRGVVARRDGKAVRFWKKPE